RVGLSDVDPRRGGRRAARAHRGRPRHRTGHPRLPDRRRPPRRAGGDPVTLDGLPTPSLLVDLDIMERNIAAMAHAFAGTGIALRPHVKTSKCWEVARRQLD